MILTDRISAFLTGIGIPVEAAEVPEGTFLPGVTLDRGRVLVDEARLAFPGDVLHEAGHVAVAPPAVRESLTGSVSVPGLDPNRLEWAAIPWSYAAALAIGIDAELVFHGGGYHGHAPGLLLTYRSGGMVGVNLLEEAGMAAGPALAAELGVPPFPHMLRWLRG